MQNLLFIASASLLAFACTPRSSAPPPSASSEPAALPGAETPSEEATGEAAEIPAGALSAFVTIEGACHWALLDPNTGKPAWSTATPSPECPHRAFRTTNINGEALLSVDIEEKGEALWHQATAQAPLTALTPLPYNEIAWFENGQIHGQTFATDPYPGPDAAEAQEGDTGSQWEHPCFIYTLDKNAPEGTVPWSKLREQMTTVSEGNNVPFCIYPEGLTWQSSRHRYPEFGSLGDIDFGIPPLSDRMLGSSWDLVPSLDATTTGETCIQDCPEGTDWVRRYAVENYWFEGPHIAGGILSASAEPGAEWALLENFKGSLEEFTLAGSQVIVCTNEGFGGWDHAKGTQTWWIDSPICPIW